MFDYYLKIIFTNKNMRFKRLYKSKEKKFFVYTKLTAVISYLQINQSLSLNLGLTLKYKNTGNKKL